VKHRLSNNAGYSLIETLVAVVVFSIAIVFVWQMLWSGQTTVEYEGERRVALKRAELKAEELKYAGFYSSGPDNNWTSLNLDSSPTGEVHPDTSRIVLDDRDTESTVDDLVGSMTWTVTDTSWTEAGVTVDAKIVDIEVVWPEGWDRDRVRLVTLVGE
jgi:prepilin-type N-terminal cleavage/methylation domain-containing protein